MVITTDFQIDEVGMTVPYPPLLDDIRRNHGFFDLRGRPDLAAEIAEGLQSTAMQGLLVTLAQPCSHLFTLGCDLGEHEQSESNENGRYAAGGYLQLMSSAYAERSPEDYEKLGDA